MSEPIPTAAQVFELAGLDVGLSLRDRLFTANCEQCRMSRLLSDCRQTVADEQRVYRCPGCQERLVLILRPLKAAIEESGWCFGDWVIANSVDVLVKTTGRPLVLDARRNATTIDARLQQIGAVKNAVADDGKSGD